MPISDKIAGFVRSIFKKENEQLKSDVPQTNKQDSAYMQFGYDALNEHLRLDRDLMSRYVDYENMDSYADLSSALDIYADDSTQIDSETNRSLWIECEDENVQNDLTEMLDKRVRVEDRIWDISRTLCKYGVDYEEILVNEDGVQGVRFLPPPITRRVESTDDVLLGFMRSQSGDFRVEPKMFDTAMLNGVMADDKTILYEPWKVANFRLNSKIRNSKEGFSVLEASRWIWKRLVLIEDAMLVYRLTRSPSRYAFYIDTGDMDPDEATAHVQRQRNSFKKRKFVNSDGTLDMKYNALSNDEDIWIPTRSGKDSTRIELLQGSVYQGIEDVDYFRMKLYAAIKIPRAYLGYEDTISRSTLSLEDVKFGRMILRIQRMLKSGFNQVARTHLAIRGLDPAAVDFETVMTVPSSAFEIAQMEVRSMRAELAESMREWVDEQWIMENIFGFTSSEVEKIIARRAEDAVRAASIEGRQEKIRMGISAKNMPPGQSVPMEDVEVAKNRLRQRYERRATFGSHRNVSVDKIMNAIHSNAEMGKRFQELRGLMNEVRDVIKAKKAA